MTRRRSIPSYPIRARLWRLKLAALAETARLRAATKETP